MGECRRILTLCAIIGILVMFFNGLLISSNQQKLDLSRPYIATIPRPVMFNINEEKPEPQYETQGATLTPDQIAAAGKPPPDNKGRKMGFGAETSEKPMVIVDDDHPSDEYIDTKVLPTLSSYQTTVLMITYNRPNNLKKAVEALFRAPGFHEISHFVISQDDSQHSTTSMIKVIERDVPEGVTFDHFQRLQRPAGEPVWHIAHHYQFALEKAFENIDSEFVIIIEDDLIASPDLLIYFDQVAKFLLPENEDDKVWCASAWNDLGFKHFYLNESSVFRTHFFPGLGWMMHKKTWMDDIKGFMPPTSWDWYFRTSFIHKDRDCIIPEKPRIRSIEDAIGATVRNKKTYKELLNNIDHTKTVPEKPIDVSLMPYNEYERSVIDCISSGIHLPLNYEFKNSNSRKPGVYVIPYLYESLDKIFRSIDITYHTQERTHHNHYIRIHVTKDVTLLLINARISKYAHFIENAYIPPDPTLEAVASEVRLKNCDDLCRERDMSCDQSQFDYINNCDMMMDNFPCERGCQVETGNEIPCYVSGKKNKNYGMCIITLYKKKSLCRAAHRDTQRLCPCVQKK